MLRGWDKGNVVEFVKKNYFSYNKKEIDNTKQIVTILKCSNINILYDNMKVCTQMIS